MSTPFDQELLYSLKEISYSYRSNDNSETTTTVLRGIDLSIRHGEYLAIMGASGSGKTTLMNLLGLLATPSAGDLHFYPRVTEGNGNTARTLAVAQLDEEHKAALRNRHIGFVFQHFALLPRLTLLENALMPALYADQSQGIDLAAIRTRARKLFEQLAIGGLEDRLPNEVSGGQKQRAAICRALLLEPDVILADEPTGALDSKTTDSILDLFRELNSAGQTIILITHDAHVGSSTDRTLRMQDGEIVADQVNPKTILGEQISPAQKTAAALTALQRNTQTRPRLRWMGTAFHYLTRIVSNAASNLWANRLRSVLTGLGLGIGVTSILLINGLGTIVNNVFDKLFYNAGTNKIYLYFDYERSATKGVRYWSGMDLETEFRDFAQRMQEYGTFRPFVSSRNCNIQSISKPARASIDGMFDHDEFLEMATPLQRGRFPNPIEIASGTAVTVLGIDAVDNFFGKEDSARTKPDFPVGERLTVSGCDVALNLTVIGVLDRRDATFGARDANDRMYVPAEALLRSKGSRRVTFFSALPRDGIDPKWLADYAKNYLQTKAPANTYFAAGVPAETIEKIRFFLLIIQGLTGFIGALCIVVGGIGIMNIMIVTVTERVREIGIMKSQGAKPSHVRDQFIAESTLLCAGAGAAGVTIGLLIVNLLSFGTSVFFPKSGGFLLVTAPWGIAIGLLVSFLCGIGFGFLPALRASRLEPAECMREE
jgi:macrolide transport system ATP-binding/permease protein